MDAVLLSRIQFGIAAGFHFLFPPITLGLTLIIVIIEVKYYKKGEEFLKKLSTFLIKILGLVFAVGVATGIVLEFSFGTNWANYSRFVGDIFGAPLAAEGIIAFFLESVFLGVLLFGRNKVSKKVYLVSAILVCVASHLSGLWIIIANSWMQTPAGFIETGTRVELANFLEAALNHSTIQRFTHTIVGAWITGSLFTAGISAWYLIKNQALEYAKPLLKISLVVFIATAFLQFGTGHAHSVQVARTNPEKMAAFEALWTTQKRAPMSIIGIPDPVNKVTHFEIAVPSLLSYMIYFDADREVKGLDAFPEEDLPPVIPTYISYHIMIGLGALFAGLALLSILLLILKKSDKFKIFHYLLILAAPLPLVANEFGWIAAEIGRQPWVVYRLLRTADAASVTVSAGEVLFSLIVFSLIFILLFLVFMMLFFRLVKQGPENITEGY